jgi:cell division septum initiation protein DivIVA
MRRLEFTRRTVRTITGRARNPAEAAMHLAHVARERHRLQQERQSLEKRIRKIEARLTSIAGTESRLTPVLQGSAASPAQRVADLVRAVAAPPPPPISVGEMTLQY